MTAAALGAARKLIDEAESIAEQDTTRARLLAGDVQRLLVPSASAGDRARLLMVLAVCDQKEERYADAAEHAEQAAYLFEETGDKERQYASLKILMTVRWRRGEYPVALDAAQKCLACAESLGDVEKTGRMHNNIGVLYYCLGRYEEAVDNFQHSLTAAEATGDHDWTASALGNIGNMHANAGDDIRALEYQFRALGVVEAHNSDDKGAIATKLMNVAAVFQRIGDYEQALDYHQRGLALREEVGNRLETGTSLHNIGLIYHENGKHEQAREYLLKSLALYEDVHGLGEKAQSLVNLSSVELRLGNVDEADRYGREALEIALSNGDKRTHYYALLHIGNVHSARQQTDDAMRLLLEGLAICREIGYSKGEVESLLVMSDVSVQMDNPGEAIGHLHAALALTETTGDKPLVIKVHRALARVYERVRDIEKAFEHLKMHHALEKEIFNETSERRLRTLQIVHKLQEARREAEIYRLKNGQLEQQVDHQTKELATKAMYLSQRSDLLFKIRKELLRTVDSPRREASKQVRDVVQMIDATLDDQQTWDAFEAQFKQVHHTFVEIMKERYPALSATELKVCALIKINLSSKEICRLLNVSPRSIDIYRHRIRKKMGLSSEENLASFLAGLH